MSDSFSVSNGVYAKQCRMQVFFWLPGNPPPPLGQDLFLNQGVDTILAPTFMGTALINNLIYADDLVILAPSHVGLSMLLLSVRTMV